MAYIFSSSTPYDEESISSFTALFSPIASLSTASLSDVNTDAKSKSNESFLDTVPDCLPNESPSDSQQIKSALPAFVTSLPPRSMNATDSDTICLSNDCLSNSLKHFRHRLQESAMKHTAQIMSAGVEKQKTKSVIKTEVNFNVIRNRLKLKIKAKQMIQCDDATSCDVLSVQRGGDIEEGSQSVSTDKKADPYRTKQRSNPRSFKLVEPQSNVIVNINNEPVIQQGHRTKQTSNNQHISLLPSTTIDECSLIQPNISVSNKQSDNSVSDMQSDNSVSNIQLHNSVSDLQPGNSVSDIQPDNSVSDIQLDNSISDVQPDNFVFNDVTTPAVCSYMDLVSGTSVDSDGERTGGNEAVMKQSSSLRHSGEIQCLGIKCSDMAREESKWHAKQVPYASRSDLNETSIVTKELVKEDEFRDNHKSNQKDTKSTSQQLRAEEREKEDTTKATNKVKKHNYILYKHNIYFIKQIHKRRYKKRIIALPVGIALPYVLVHLVQRNFDNCLLFAQNTIRRTIFSRDDLDLELYKNAHKHLDMNKIVQSWKMLNTKKENSSTDDDIYR